MSEVKTPWKDYMGDVPMHLDYFQGSMFEAVERMAELYPNNIAFDFMGKSTTYKKMVQEIEKCAKSLKTLGVRPGDKVTIAMPNCPQAIYMFYAVNLVGGIANMIHPLSAEKEIEFYLNASESTTAITLDQFYDKFEHIRQNTGIINIIIASVKDALSRTIRAGYMLTEGRKIQKIPEDAPVIRWKEFMDMSRYCFYKNYRVERGYNDPAVILYSGGTTGTTKGIVLTNGNFNALGQQIIATNPMFRPGDRMLAAMPLFHGFGLGVCVHSMLSQGGRCILIPRFTAKSYAKQIVKYKCNFIAGVPTLYEALLRLPSMDGADLSSLKGVFSGGDSLSIELKKKFDKFLSDHHAVIQVREGYGTTETVKACCLTPALPRHLYQDRGAGHRQGGALRHRGRDPAGRSHRHEGIHEQPRGDGPHPAQARRRPDLGVHRRPGHHGRPGLHLLQGPRQADDHHLRLQRLPRPAGEHSGRPRGRADELHHRRTRSL